jgi:hypothetical protein
MAVFRAKKRNTLRVLHTAIVIPSCGNPKRATKMTGNDKLIAEMNGSSAAKRPVIKDLLWSKPPV